jgi:GTPase SAR1 family protein
MKLVSISSDIIGENVNINEVVLMVVGNKVDLEEERKVPTDRPINEFQKKFDIECWETSAKTGFNVEKVFNQLVESTVLVI